MRVMTRCLNNLNRKRQDGLMMPELSKDNYTIEVSLMRGGFTKSLCEGKNWEWLLVNLTISHCHLHLTVFSSDKVVFLHRITAAFYITLYHLINDRLNQEFLRQK